MSTSSIEFNGMSRWQGRSALVTGCSSGIGAAITKALLHYGVNVIGCDLNLDGAKALAETCTNAGLKGTLIPYQCDVGKATEIEAMFEWIEKEHKGIDICVNNAGAGSMTSLLELGGEEMTSMLNSNVMGVVLCSNLAVKSMLERKIDDGHIVNMSSIFGHTVVGLMNFYSATKHAVTALTKGLRMELSAKGTRIKVTQISPGRVQTGFHPHAFGDPVKGQKFYEYAENLQPTDIADAVMYALSAPAHSQIYDIMLQPTLAGNVQDVYAAAEK